MNSYLSSRIAFVAVLILTFGQLTPQPVVASAPEAASIVVSSHADVINYDDHLCTLREAIIAANTDSAPVIAIGECLAGSGSDTILLESGIYTFTIAGREENASLTGDLDITSPITIQGSGIDCLNPTKECTQINADSLDRVFDVSRHGNLTLEYVLIHNGSTYNESGGGIYNWGNLTLDNAAIVDCHAATGQGGGLYNDGSASISHSLIVDNQADTHGGGIFNMGELVVNYSQFTTNHSGAYGGGIFVTDGITTIDHSIFNNNTSAISGGGIYIQPPATISNTLFYQNSATDSGGAFFQNGYYTSTFTNVTMSGNTAENGGAAAVEMGAEANLLNVTIFGNQATSQGDGIFVDGADATVNIQNTLIAGNFEANCAGTITSLGNNLEDADTCGLSGTGDLVNTAPLLGVLEDNGGFSFTHALLPDSPAIDAGSETTCPDVDQRGVLRPQDGDLDGTAVCDIGAFEVNHLKYIYLPVLQK
ncbi:MAG TPA: choice-of-anchor Q domain-containing protein [Anaerolineaceae bacterium]|nr:choice-of-anchor Q domain-containing protein [Anaerolineaceae bacterium]